MTTCQVLRCDTPAAQVFVLYDEPLLEKAVCPEHHQRLVAGDRWMIDTDDVLMDSDIPPTVVEYYLSDLLGSEKGVSLNLHLNTPNGPRSQTIWLSTEDADGLGDLLTNRLLR